MNQRFLCFVLTWLSCTAANVPIRSCSGCIGYASCPAAVTLLHMKTPASDTRLKNAFCGFDSASLPKVCCSELTPVQPTRVLTEIEGVENHPNLGLLPSECGKIDGDKIIGGTIAGLYEYPWMVLISYNSRVGLRFECGGTLINERYVLTAAHCIANLKLAGVRVGEHDVDTSPDCEGEPPLMKCESRLQDLRIETAIPHENYQGKPLLKNDIGLLRLKKPVNLTYKNAATICLPVTKELQNRDLGGLNATVAGWGYTETGRVSSKLLRVEVPIHTKESCSQLYNRGAAAGAEDQTLNKLCAGQNGKDSCGGDSGGPLMVKGAYKTLGHRFIQHGVVSYGPRLCGSDFPGVYTDVSKYMTWILNNIKP